MKKLIEITKNLCSVTSEYIPNRKEINGFMKSSGTMLAFGCFMVFCSLFCLENISNEYAFSLEFPVFYWLLVVGFALSVCFWLSVTFIMCKDDFLFMVYEMNLRVLDEKRNHYLTEINYQLHNREMKKRGVVEMKREYFSEGHSKKCQPCDCIGCTNDSHLIYM